MSRLRTYSQKEELFNTLSHAAGIVLGLVAGAVLISKAYQSHDPWKVYSVLVYLFGMLSCYIISTFYHACKADEKKWLLQKFDHASIYLHIAGTYTPFTLVTLRNETFWGWALFAFVWLSAVVGVIISFKKQSGHSTIETACYVIMGCSIVVAFKPLVDVLSRTGEIEVLYWLIGGGVSYIVGALFYSFAGREYMHTIFHIFVLGGSICHIMAIYAIL